MAWQASLLYSDTKDCSSSSALCECEAHSKDYSVFFFFTRTLCLNVQISKTLLFISGYSGSPGCFIQPRWWRLQHHTAVPARRWWRVAWGGDGPVWERVHPTPGPRGRTQGDYSLAWAESGNHYWPISGDDWQLFSFRTQPQLHWWVKELKSQLVIDTLINGLICGFIGKHIPKGVHLCISSN